MSSRGHTWNPCIVPLRLFYRTLLNSEGSWLQYCSFPYRFQKCYNGKMYPTAKALFSPLQPCLGRGWSLSQHIMVSYLRDRKGMPPAPSWCWLFCKLRQSVTDTCRAQSGWAWESTASFHITASVTPQSGMLSCHPLTFFLLRPQRLAHLPSSHYHCLLLPIKVLSLL